MPDRLSRLRRYAACDILGIEVAPYFNPIIRKSEGYNVLIVDVFDEVTLRDKAREDPLIPKDQVDKIEVVDIVADASAIGEAVAARKLEGQIGYIVSSHNFEHLPDPIRFLQGCTRALAPGGMLSMAIPDCRACFDHFRMPTRLSDWLAAYHRGDRQPAPETAFDCSAHLALYHGSHGVQPGCDICIDDPAFFVPPRRLRDVYAQYLGDHSAPGPYRDAHCSTVFGASFELMLRDLRHLGLVDLEVVEVTETIGLEFFAHLRKTMPTDHMAEDDTAFYSRREDLLRKVVAGMGLGGFRPPGSAPEVQFSALQAKPWRLIRKTLHSALLNAVATTIRPVMPHTAVRLRRASKRRSPWSIN